MKSLLLLPQDNTRDYIKTAINVAEVGQFCADTNDRSIAVYKTRSYWNITDMIKRDRNDLEK